MFIERLRTSRVLGTQKIGERERKISALLGLYLREDYQETQEISDDDKCHGEKNIFREYYIYTRRPY